MANVKDFFDDTPIIIYYYFDLSDTDDFCKKLEKWFRDSGHTRPLEFRSWNCYNDKPDHDGDIYCYDAIVMSNLVNEGYLHELPDIIDTSKVFPWILDRSRIKRKIYGIPLMACANVLICKEEDYFPMDNIFDIPQGLAAPLKSMASFYYLYAFCNIQNKEDAIHRIVKQLRLLMSDDSYTKSRFADYDGLSRFKNGECKFIIGFTEDIRRLDKGNYKVQPLNMSDNAINEMPLYPIDLASLGKNVSGEKLLDCLDLMEIISNSDFIYDINFSDGKLQYMLPTDMTLYPRLAEVDPIYNDFYEFISNENNGILRYGKHYYEVFPEREKQILEILNN